MSVFKRSPKEGRVARRLEENIPSGPIDVPLLIGQGGADQLISPPCKRGTFSGSAARASRWTTAPTLAATT